MSSPSSQPPICKGCGILVDASRTSCRTCQTAHASPPLRAAAQPAGGYWVAVRGTFICNACRFEVPLNHFELGEGVVCTRCGLEQRYDESNWRDLTDFAHAVGDLFSRPSEPNPFSDLGTRRSWAQEKRWRASPGNPLCRACKSPRVVLAKRGRELDVGCTGCAEKTTYELPERIRIERLGGVLADEHEKGRSEASIVDENGVVVLRCPNCSAPLTGVKDEDGIVTCGYCKVPCRISSRTHARAGHERTPVKTWWLYFDQPSLRRERLAREAREEAAERERQRRAAERAQREAVKALERAKKVEAEAKASEWKALMPLLSVMVLAPIAGGVIWFQHHKKESEAEKARAAEESARPGDDAILKYSFAMTSEETTALFGPAARPGAKVKLRPGGLFQEVELGLGAGPTYNVSFLATKKLDADRTIARLAKLSPNHLVTEMNGMREIHVGRTAIRFETRAMPSQGGRLSVMTWVKGEQGRIAADAFLAAAKYAALDGPEPTPEQLLLLNGPPLADAARFDVTVPIEGATAAFEKAFVTADCKAINDLLAGRTELVCTAEVDDRTIDKIQLAWPSSEKAHLRRVRFTKRKDADPTACLTGALGEGEKKVLDFASNRGELRWPLGKRGDHVALDGAGIEIRSRDGAKPEERPDWLPEYERVVNVIAGCGR